MVYEEDMLQIGKSLISLDLIENFFCCDLSKCKGECCIEGDAGAPITDDEYKIIKDLQPYVEISESTLYPILRRLESAGALNVYSAEHNGRLRKYYAITATGRERIREFLEEWKGMLAIYEYIKGEMNENE